MDVEWYIGRDGETTGPFSFDHLRTSARNQSLTKVDFVWRAGTPEWVKAGDLAELWLPPEIPKSTCNSPPPLNIAHQELNSDSVAIAGISHLRPSSATAESKQIAIGTKLKVTQENELRRFWRGEVSLAKSYWVYGVLISVSVALLSYLIGASLENPDVGSSTRFAVLFSWILALAILTVWQCVGIWRAAGTHMRITQRKGWAIAARVAIVYGLLQFIVAIAPLLTILGETLRLARGNDSTPAYQLRLMRDGTELEIGGGMPFGTADAVKKFIDAAPAIKVVHLNNNGGRIAEGLQLMNLFRGRGMVTYTSTNCYSACTIAFLGGTRRYLSETAKLGFHSSSFAGLDENDIPGLNDSVRAILLEHGASKWFVDKALSTPPESMWHPLQSELLEAKIVTSIVDPSQFAMSGFIGWQNTQEIESMLTKAPYVRVLKQYNPDAYKKIASLFTEGIKLGKSQPEVSSEIYRVFSAEIIPGYLQSAPDAALVRYWKSQIAEISYLAESQPQQCLAFLQLVPRQANFDLSKLMPAELLQEDLASLAAIIEETHTVPGTPLKPSEAEKQQLYTNIFATLDGQNPGVSSLVSEPAKFLDQPQLVCRSFVAFYDVILGMPTEKAAKVLRTFSDG